jgi:OMF family outer membrane factor
MRFVILFLVLQSTALGAAPGLTLEAAIEAARGGNPALKQAELQADASGWGKLEALSEHLPHLGARATHFLDAKYSRLGVLFGGNAVEFPTGFPQTEFELEASLLLFDGLGSINRYRAATLEAEAATLELEHARFRLEEGVRVRFHQALAAQELARVADQNIETLAQHLKLAQASRRAGFSTSVDVLRLESQMEEARAEKILAEDNVAIARTALFEAMAVPADERPLQGALPAPDRKLPDDLKLDVAARQDLQAQSRREEAQDRLNSAAGAYWVPRVSLFAYEQFYKFGEFDPAILPNATFQNAYGLGLRLTWNLFDGGAAIARKARADDAAAIAREATRQQQIASAGQFETWKRRYVYNAALYQARRRSVEKSTESVRLATISVRAGTKTHSEALDAELELFRARAGVIRAQVDAAEALAQLELALGHPLR